VIKSRIMRWAAHVARVGEGRVVYRALVGEPEERDNLGDPGVDERIKIDLPEVGCVGMDWMELTQDRNRWRSVVTAVMNLLVHKMRGIS